ncbi:MAG: hypothetical protein HC855_11970 [Rhizobiales bacterium]|nr:hypothetical protein [Hyphomicrobiales bacterium]
MNELPDIELVQLAGADRADEWYAARVNDARGGVSRHRLDELPAVDAAYLFGFEQIVEHRADQLFEPSQPLPRKTMDGFDESRGQRGENDKNGRDRQQAGQERHHPALRSGAPRTETSITERDARESGCLGA